MLDVVRGQDAKIDLKIDVMKTKLPRLGISKGEEAMLGKRKMDQLDQSTA